MPAIHLRTPVRDRKRLSVQSIECEQEDTIQDRPSRISTLRPLQMSQMKRIISASPEPRMTPMNTNDC